MIANNRRNKNEEENNVQRAAREMAAPVTNQQEQFQPYAQQQNYQPTAQKNTNVLSQGTIKSDLNKIRTNLNGTYKQGNTVTNIQKQLDSMKKQPTYKQDKTVKTALKDLNSLQRPDEYTSAYQDKINSLLSQMENDGGFTYDPESDPLYQSYRDQYLRLGRRAMEDSMGNAAALTGGYGNTYAQSVGQQSYQDYLTQLNDQMPNLYNLSYQNYRDQVGDRQQLYNNYTGLENTDYSRYLDTMDQYNTDRNYLTDYYRDIRDTDYNRYRDTVGDYNTNRNYLLQRLQGEQDYDINKYKLGQTDEQNRIDLLRLQLANMEKNQTGGGGGGGNQNPGGTETPDDKKTGTQTQKEQQRDVDMGLLNQRQKAITRDELLNLKKKLGL